jgi:GNAT superfamily N-acetyltransferase
LSLLIRPACDADAGQIVSLIAACWVQYPGNILDIQGEERELRAPAAAFREKGGQLWVAHRDKWVVGCVGVAPGKDRRDHAQLLKLYVHPRLRRQGLARNLAALPEQAAREWKADAIELWSDRRFREAHAFYRAIGYTTTGQVRALHDLSNSTERHFIKALEPR